MRISKPEELPRSYRDAYWLNWQNRMYKKPVNPNVRGRCYGCGKGGVLGVDLIHRGETRRTNLLCDDCCDE